MKKSLAMVFALFLFVNANSQIINPNCWYPSVPYHCEANKQKMDNYTYTYVDTIINTNVVPPDTTYNTITINTFKNHAVYQANDSCIYMQWFFPLHQENGYLLGLKIRITGGGINDEVIIHSCPPVGSLFPFENSYGNYIYTSQTASDPSAVKVTFIYSELDWLSCTYEGLKFQDYFGYPAPLCVPTGSFQNEGDNDFGDINISSAEKVAGLYPTVVTDYINISDEEEIKLVEVIDINGRLYRNSIPKFGTL